jgi:hypothetical protein
MEHQFLHLIIAPLVLHPKCELAPNEHSMYLRFIWLQAIDLGPETMGKFHSVKYLGCHWISAVNFIK